MQIITHKIQSMMVDINTIRQFIIRYENDSRMLVDVREQLFEELAEREKVVFGLLKSEYNTQLKIERESNNWYDKDKQEELLL